jgi:8-oxo-dGTP pyrophosphatase MutT (NUDIX family)
MVTKRHNFTPSVFLILIKDNKILLSKRRNTGHWDGYYGLVSGHVHETEPFLKAMIREAKEEANIALTPSDLKFIYLMCRTAPDNPPEIRDRVDIYFSAAKWESEIKNMEPEKCSDLSWFDLNELPPNTIPYIKASIENIKIEKLYDEFGF